MKLISTLIFLLCVTFAFAECYELTTIKIPSSVTYIGRGALYGCVKLESIFLPFVGAYKGGSRDDASLFGYIFGGLNDTYIAADGSINNMTYVQSNASSFWQFEQRYYNVRSFDSNFAPIAITEEDENYEFPPVQLLAEPEKKANKGGKKAVMDTATKLQKTL